MANPTLTMPELAAKLRERRGAFMVTLTTNTDARSLKKDRGTGEPNPYGKIRKESQVNGIVNFNYENAVNRQREREGGVDAPAFAAAARRNGERIKGTPFVMSSRGNVLLRLKVERATVTPRYLAADGTPIPKIPGLLPAPRKDSGRQEVKKEIIERDYALDSVVGITVNGTTYDVTPAVDKAASMASLAASLAS